MPSDESKSRHPSMERWCAYVDGSADEAEARHLAEHLQLCDACFATVAELRQSVDEALESAAAMTPTPPELRGRAQGRAGRGRRLVYAAAAVVLVVGGLWYAWQSPELPPAAPAEEFFVEAPSRDAAEFGFAKRKGALPTIGTINVLVIFAQFQDEAQDGEELPDYANRLFDPDEAGSFTHFYNTMTFDQVQIRGTVLPKRYTTDKSHNEYLGGDNEYGGFGQFVEDILAKVDEEEDFAQFDNDGKDGVPNSGDDDGWVDYVFVIVRSTPRNFIYGKATGIAGFFRDEMGTDLFVATRDVGASSEPIHISGARKSSTILRARTFNEAVATMAHEFGHGFGLPDLYDNTFQEVANQPPADDGAGIGRWGLMGNGAQGWKNNDGPTPFSAWTRERQRWIGPLNERLVRVRRDTTVLIEPLDRGGQIYRIPLHPYISPSKNYKQEYLLLEMRTRASHFDRNLPEEGLLIWHVRPQIGRENKDEHKKLLDVVCADGRYADAGYPDGSSADATGGGDNLDFWAHDEDYRRDYGGNTGDATDVFDGETYREFSMFTNPSTAVDDRHNQANSGLHLSMERQGEAMRVHISMPRWSGTLSQEAVWIEEIVVDGDLVIAPKGRLVLYPSTHVRVAPGAQIRVEGEVEIVMERIIGTRIDRKGKSRPKYIDPESLVFEALEEGETWRGIDIAPGGRVLMVEGDLVLRDTASVALDAKTFSKGEDVATAILDEKKKEEPPEEQVEPITFELMPNYPNPFTTETTLRYQLPVACGVQLVIYNSLGQAVRHLVDDHQWEGEQEVMWDGLDDRGSEMASGVYLYRLTIPPEYVGLGENVKQGKMMCLRGGLSSLIPLDETLRQRGRDGSRLADRLANSAPEAAFGFAAEAAPDQAAFTTGLVWANLRILLQYGDAPSTTREQAELLGELATYFAPATEGSSSFTRLAGRVERGLSKAALDQLDTDLARLVQHRGEQAAAYYALGQWLQRLRVTALAARDLRTPLSQVLELLPSAEAGRHFTAYLKLSEADPNLTDNLEQLSSTLETDPANRRQLTQLLDLLDTISDPLIMR